MLNNRRLQASYGELGVARADLVQAGLLINPVLNADLTFGVSAPGHGVAIGLVQNFMRALQIPLRKRVAEAALEEAKFAVASQVIDLVVEVKRAFVERWWNWREYMTAVLAAPAVAAWMDQARALPPMAEY